ncbi:MAG: hypothetical protein QGI35_04000 [Arenicellales bacterium]|jgi:hypothetical protein|nr:hypothetical protein [Arenicellales bacterium]|tara:strand:- start:483 stop:983 length:501 start_codon:yes stop_codon:yes gene_type:complete
MDRSTGTELSVCGLVEFRALVASAYDALVPGSADAAISGTVGWCGSPGFRWDETAAPKTNLLASGALFGGAKGRLFRTISQCPPLCHQPHVQIVAIDPALGGISRTATGRKADQYFALKPGLVKSPGERLQSFHTTLPELVSIKAALIGCDHPQPVERYLLALDTN